MNKIRGIYYIYNNTMYNIRQLSENIITNDHLTRLLITYTTNCH